MKQEIEFDGEVWRNSDDWLEVPAPGPSAWQIWVAGLAFFSAFMGLSALVQYIATR